MARLGEQRTNRRLGLVVLALTEVRIANAPTRVDQILGGPVLVAPRFPGPVSVVLNDRVAEPVLTGRALDVARVALEDELGSVNADDREAPLAVSIVPSLQRRQRSDAIDAGVSPEVDQHDASTKCAHRKRASTGVEPALGFAKLGRLSQDRKRFGLG